MTEGNQTRRSNPRPRSPDFLATTRDCFVAFNSLRSLEAPRNDTNEMLLMLLSRAFS